MLVEAVVWACVLPPLLLTPTAHAQAFRVQDLLAGGSSDLLRSSSSVPSPCVTPDGEKGVCGSATTCPSYLSLLNNLQNETVLAFFRTRVCRHSPGVLHVCCPLQGSVSSPKPLSSSIFLFGPSEESQPSRGSSLRPSQRPNARQPAGAVLMDSATEEDEENRDFLMVPVFPSQPSPSLASSQFQTTPRPTQGPPILSMLPPTIQGTETLSPSTGVFLSPDREPPGRGSLNPATLVPQDQAQPHTEPQVPSILPVEGACGSTTQGKTPWTVALGVLTKDEFRITCGGALVSRLHVLAAAHCLQNPVPSHVRLGDHGTREHMVDVPLRSALDAGYNPATREKDLALLTLAAPVTYSDNIRPVCLPFPYRLDGFRGQVLQVLGYGSTGNLQVGEVEILGLRECRAAYQSPSLVSNNEVALFSRPSSPSSSSSSSSSSFSLLINPRTSSSVVVDRRNLCGSLAPSSSSTTCLSDHGAPLYFHDEETTGLYFLAGVSSLGNSCQTGPGLYTRVGAYIPWLSQQLSGVEAQTSSPTFRSGSTRTLQRINRNRG